MNINVHAKMQGLFRLVISDGDSGEVTKDTGWFDNLITDAGLEMKATEEIMRTCQIGSGSTTPAFTDTQLDNFVASTTSVQTNQFGDQIETLPYYGWARSRYRFETGEAEGNITEVGVTNLSYTSSSGPLFSRALILDETGNPTTLTILSNEILDVWYEVRLIIPTDDFVETVDINGVSTEVRTRPISIDGSSNTSDYGFGGWNLRRNPAAISITGFHGGVRAYSGDFGLMTDHAPQGSSDVADGGFNDSYISGSLERTATATWEVDSANFQDGIKTVRFRSGVGSYQTGFTPAIPKDNTQELSINLKTTWGRYVP